ncbi:SET domain-containing protein 9-like [Daphnia pulex]|uniref:SET domain-containing protein 9-like n=1 Tax=Daphnia pulex TaxID=6669 RepID=UPI001EDE5409|nr:SET domain-containing protein 9-like [Daphnia pulex]
MKELWHVLKNKWLSYRYRFVPWVALNFKDKSHRSVSRGDDKITPDDVIVNTLLHFSTSLHKHFVDGNKNPIEALKVMERVLGYTIQLRKSNIPEAGTGVFVSKGTVTAGSIVALYPGTVYRVMEPLLLQSIVNPFIFRCIDGLHIDGKDRGISRKIFKSCVYRDLRWPFFPADLTWLTGDLINPLNCGQYVNNETPEYPCNVAYQECDLPIDRFPIELRCYLPNIYYSSSEGNQTKFLRVVALVAVKDIGIDTELFSTYYTVVHA